MARTIAQIQNSIITQWQSTPELATANSTSRRAIWRLITFVQATAIAILEQLIDAYIVTIENKIAVAIPNTYSWIKQKILEFQYDANNPQIVELIDFAPKYPIVDESLRIVTRCAVVSNVANQVIIKVAKQDPPIALTVPEVEAVQDYIDIIGVAGINYFVTSAESDKLYIKADIYFDGQYSAVIKTTVNTSITNYLANLPFNGVIKVSDLEMSIKNTLGVSDVVFSDLKVRSNITPFADGQFLVKDKTIYSRLLPLISGYVTEETESGATFSNTLTFIAI